MKLQGLYIYLYYVSFDHKCRVRSSQCIYSEFLLNILASCIKWNYKDSIFIYIRYDRWLLIRGSSELLILASQLTKHRKQGSSDVIRVLFILWRLYVDTFYDWKRFYWGTIIVRWSALIWSEFKIFFCLFIKLYICVISFSSFLMIRFQCGQFKIFSPIVWKRPASRPPPNGPAQKIHWS